MQRPGMLLSLSVLRKRATGAMALSAMLKVDGSLNQGLAIASGGAFVFQEQKWNRADQPIAGLKDARPAPNHMERNRER